MLWFHEKIILLFNHLRNATVCQYVARVYEAVKQLCRLFDEVGLVRIVFKLVIRLEVKNHVESLAVVWYLEKFEKFVKWLNLSIALCGLTRKIVRRNFNLHTIFLVKSQGQESCRELGGSVVPGKVWKKKSLHDLKKSNEVGKISLRKKTFF